MIVDGLSWMAAGAWRTPRAAAAADLVLYFGARAWMEDGRRFADLRALYPKACLVGCSTGGRICAEDVEDGGMTGVAVTLERSSIRFHSTTIDHPGQSRRRGLEIAQALRGDDLAGVLLLSDGLNVNGSELVAGAADAIGLQVPISGGLAGDGPHFSRTLVGADQAPRPNVIAAVGFYGQAVRIGHGSAGGWSVFGPRRMITNARDNVL
jgi:hypothetical protein